MNRQPLVLAASVLLLTAAGMSASPASEAEQPYVIRDGRVYLPRLDDSSATSHSAVLLDVEPDAFAGSVHVYNKRALIGNVPAVSTEFTIPPGAGELIVAGRSRVESDIFPRLRISLDLVTSETGSLEAESRVVYEGHAQSLSTERITTPLPAGLSGRTARLRIEVLNPGGLNDVRTYYFARASFRKSGD